MVDHECIIHLNIHPVSSMALIHPHTFTMIIRVIITVMASLQQLQESDYILVRGQEQPANVAMMILVNYLLQIHQALLQHQWVHVVVISMWHIIGHLQAVVTIGLLSYSPARKICIYKPFSS